MEKCKHTEYKTVKESEDTVARHKCICANCGIELHPITLRSLEEIENNEG